MSWPPDVLDGVIEAWPRCRPAMSLHLRCAIAYAHSSPRQLGSGDAVPGCPCDKCTGLPDSVPSDHDTRVTAAARDDWDHRVEDARSIPILGVANRLGVELRGSGTNYLGRSPFRDDKSPSLSVSPGKNLWYDFGAGIGGDGIKLWMLTKKVDFATAVRDLTA